MATASAQDTDVTSASATTQITDVDLESIKEEELPEELRPKYRALIRGFHKKMQTVADEKKDFDSQKIAMGDAKKKHDEIIKWYEENKVEDQIKELIEYRNKFGFLSAARTVASAIDTSELGELNKEAVKALIKSERRDMEQGIRKEFANALALTSEQYMDLAILAVKDPKMEWREVVKVAQKEGLQDMKKAYNHTYAEKIAKVKEDAIRAEYEEKLEKEKEKIKVDVLNEARPEGRKVLRVLKKK